MPDVALVIDKDFMLGFFNNRKLNTTRPSDEQIKVFEDYIAFLENDYRKAHFILITDFDYTEVDPSEDNILCFIQMIENRIIKPIIIPDLSKKINEPNFYTQFTPFKLFFVQNLPDNYKTLKKQYGCYFITFENITDEWKKLQYYRQDNKMVVGKAPFKPNEQYFNNWDKPQLLSHALNSILIFDRYILADENAKTNLRAMLDKLLLEVASSIPISILLFFQVESGKVQLGGADGADTRNFIQTLENDLQAKGKNISVCAVGYAHPSNKALRDNPTLTLEHDRFVITNYFNISSGAGFDLFDSNGDAKNRTRVLFDMVFEFTNAQYTLYALKNLKTYLSIADANECYPNKQTVAQHPFLQ